MMISFSGSGIYRRVADGAYRAQGAEITTTAPKTSDEELKVFNILMDIAKKAIQRYYGITFEERAQFTIEQKGFNAFVKEVGHVLIQIAPHDKELAAAGVHHIPSLASKKWIAVEYPNSHNKGTYRISINCEGLIGYLENTPPLKYLLPS